MEQIKTFRWWEALSRGRTFGDGTAEEFQTMESGPAPSSDGYRTRSTPAQVGNEHGMDGPWVRGPLAVLRNAVLAMLDTVSHASDQRRRPSSSQTCHWRLSSSTRQGGVLATTPGLGAAWVPKSPGILLSACSALQEIERQRGPLLDCDIP